MRRLETVVALLTSACVLSLAFSSVWTPVALLLSVLACLAQSRYEGARWQLWPIRAALVCVATGYALQLAAVSRGTAPDATLAEYLISRGPQLLSNTAVVLAGLLTAVSSCLLVFLPVFSLPVPTGVFPVSVFDIELEDDQRPEWIEPWDHDKERSRRLVVRLAYPVEPSLRDSKSVKRAPYFGHAHLRTSAISKRKNVPQFIMGHLENVLSNSIVYQDEGLMMPPVALPGGLPVVIFSHGYCGTFDSHTAFLEDLASHGYFAASISHTHDAMTTVFASTGEVASFNATAPADMLHSVDDLRQLRQRQLQVRVDDVAFVIQQLKLLNAGPQAGDCSSAVGDLLVGRLDMGQIVAMGHSFGGATAVQALCEMADVTAAVVFDAWMFALPDSVLQGAMLKPVLFLQADKFFIENTPFGQGNTAAVASMVDAANQKAHVAALGTIHGAAHADFTDVAMLAPTVTQLAKVTKLPGPWVLRVMVTLALGFLRSALSADVELLERGLQRLSSRVAAEYASRVTLTTQPTATGLSAH